MLRKGGLAAVEPSLSPSKQSTARSSSLVSASPYGTAHDDGKHSKMKKKKASRLVKMAVAVGFGMVLLVLLVMAKSSNNNGKGVITGGTKKDGSGLLRRAVSQLDDDKDKEQDDTAGDDEGDNPEDEEEEDEAERGAAIASLPPASVYRLSVEDIYGDMVDLSKYIGMVTLIVNVACL